MVYSPLSGRGEGDEGVCTGGGGRGMGMVGGGMGMVGGGMGMAGGGRGGGRMGQDTHMAVYYLLRILLPV